MFENPTFENNQIDNNSTFLSDVEPISSSTNSDPVESEIQSVFFKLSDSQLWKQKGAHIYIFLVGITVSWLTNLGSINTCCAPARTIAWLQMPCYPTQMLCPPGRWGSM